MRLPILYTDHGAATLTARPDAPLSLALRALNARPWWPQITRALIVSAHNSAPAARIGAAPRFWHDHPAADTIAPYHPPHDPALATRLTACLTDAGIDAAQTDGALDHGAWAVLRALWPDADVPVAALSRLDEPSIEAHLAIGRALAPLRDEGWLLVFSGGIAHNQQEFRQSYLGGGAMESASAPSRAFYQWALDAAAAPATREAALGAWRDAPGAEHAQPEPSHLMPLIMACGAALSDPGRPSHAGYQHGLSASTLLFEAQQG